MRIIAYVFSGTGNTARVLSELSDELRRRGHEVDVYSLSAKHSPPPPNGYDRILVGYPVHAFNAPAPVLRFLKRLPSAGRFIPSYLVRTSGEPLKFNHAAGLAPRRILRRKGYPVRGELHYVMPYNIIFRHTEGMAARMERAVQLEIPRDALCIERGAGSLMKVGPIRRFVSLALRIEHPAMPVIGRTFHVADSCVGCGLCAERCPQGNITMKDGRPKFGGSCVGCMSCSFRCPKDAVRISLLNGWRVNGAYAFNGDPASDDEVCRYCRKSYLEYFHSAESK